MRVSYVLLLFFIIPQSTRSLYYTPYYKSLPCRESVGVRHSGIGSRESIVAFGSRHTRESVVGNLLSHSVVGFRESVVGNLLSHSVVDSRESVVLESIVAVGGRFSGIGSRESIVAFGGRYSGIGSRESIVAFGGRYSGIGIFGNL